MNKRKNYISQQEKWFEKYDIKIGDNVRIKKFNGDYDGWDASLDRLKLEKLEFTVGTVKKKIPKFFPETGIQVEIRFASRCNILEYFPYFLLEPLDNETYIKKEPVEKKEDWYLLD